MTPRHTAIVDWDGTAVAAMWPERPTGFLPGFETAMRRMHKAGIKLVICSARLSPFDPFTSQRREAHIVAGEVQYIRAMLDNAGLTFIDIWTLEGKPGGSVYIDDKAERYHGRPNSWRTLTEKILMRFKLEEPQFPAFDLTKEAV